MKPSLDSTIKELLTQKLIDLETYLNADIFTYYGKIENGIEIFINNLIEEISIDTNPKKDKLVVILTTSGGSAFAVERWVNILRQHYKVVDFIVPNYAYSAGTIFCMSGDNILMDYVSVLGPIDPQVQNKDGNWVAALGYLDKVNEAIEKSKNKTITEVEYLMVKDLDLAELRSYEQAKELAVDLLKKWLVKYKFKNWDLHKSTPQLIDKPVTLDEKKQRAEFIAEKLSDNAIWKSHGRPINIESLRDLKLKIDNFSEDSKLKELIGSYYEMLMDYIIANKIEKFVHTRKFI